MKRKSIKILIFTLVLGLLVLGGGYVGYRGYQKFRQARLVKQAKDYLDNQELRKAQLCLQRAVRYNDRDLETCRLMARLADAGGSRPAALIWRGRVVELGPASLEDQLALAHAAVATGDYATATNALAGVDEAGKKTAAFHNVAGGVSAAANLTAAAESHFREATRLEPQNPVMQLNLAMVQIRQTNTTALTQARTSLKLVAANPTNSSLRCQALRELALDALRYDRAEAAQTLTKQLLQETNSIFRDRLLHLEMLRATKSEQFNPTLAAIQKDAGTNGGAMVELCLWQMRTLGPNATLAWLRTLPEEARNDQPAALFVAECLVATKDWIGLQAVLDSQQWGELEFYRRAFKTRALRGQELGGAAKAEWELALRASGNQLRGLVMLKQFATQQQWQSEAEEILWTIVRRFPAERAAVRELSQALYLAGRTRPLMTLYAQEVQRAPKDLAVKNNLAVTALLLEANELKPHDLAREVYEKSPTNAAYASTYAYSLHVQSRNEEALKVMQSLTPKQLENPAIAGYYGLILKAAGNAEKAKVYINWGLKNQILLPEERKLFERAMAS